MTNQIATEISRPISIAIDGPAGAGKSTVARSLASDLGFVYVDTGAMYRVVAWRCAQEGVALTNEDAVIRIANAVDISFAPPYNGESEQLVFADGIEVTHDIRLPEISQAASTVSTIPKVREILVAKQQMMGESGGVVMEGRDIGTVVLPNAEVKIFLTATIDERARRRFIELEHKGQLDITFEQVRLEMTERDVRDTTRDISPLMPAADAVIIECAEMTSRQVVDAILDVITSKHPK